MLIDPSNQVRPAWLRAEEYVDLQIPMERLLKAGRLDIYPEVLNSGLFKMYFKGDQLVLQAGGWIGLLHINSELSIEITPRVPIENLERIIARSQSTQIKFLDGFSKGFAPSTYRIPSIIDMMADRLVGAVENLLRDGLHYEYEHRPYIGSFPRGRIDPARTALHRLRIGPSSQSAYETWERTYDVPPNRYIRAAIAKLLTAYSGAPDKIGRRRHISALRQADYILQRVTLVHGARKDDVAALLRRVPVSRPDYQSALLLSELILDDTGVNLRSVTGNINLAPILVRMEDVFENYVRSVLVGTTTLIAVKDGNKGPPIGARKLLIDEESGGNADHKAPPATPDLVIWRINEAAPTIVADVKYKLVSDFPTPDDRNQVLTYALTYGCKIACLFYPRRSPQSATGFVNFGKVGGVVLCMYIFDLAADDLEIEEARLIDAISDVCEGQGSVVQAAIEQS